MSETKWQPGPWLACGDLCDAVGERVVFSGLTISAGYSGDQMEQIEANSQLVRAAPDLYGSTLESVAMLQAVVRSTKRDKEWSDFRRWIVHHGPAVIERARAALAKARGES